MWIPAAGTWVIVGFLYWGPQHFSLQKKTHLYSHYNKNMAETINLQTRIWHVFKGREWECKTAPGLWKRLLIIERSGWERDRERDRERERDGEGGREKEHSEWSKLVKSQTEVLLDLSTVLWRGARYLALFNEASSSCKLGPGWSVTPEPCGVENQKQIRL